MQVETYSHNTDVPPKRGVFHKGAVKVSEGDGPQGGYVPTAPIQTHVEIHVGV